MPTATGHRTRYLTPPIIVRAVLFEQLAHEAAVDALFLVAIDTKGRVTRRAQNGPNVRFGGSESEIFLSFVMAFSQQECKSASHRDINQSPRLAQTLRETWPLKFDSASRRKRFTSVGLKAIIRACCGS
jgi:hypothetical protein